MPEPTTAAELRAMSTEQLVRRVIYLQREVELLRLGRDFARHGLDTAALRAAQRRVRRLACDALKIAVERLERAEEGDGPCPRCLAGEVVNDTCDDCGERHCPACEPCEGDAA